MKQTKFILETIDIQFLKNLLMEKKFKNMDFLENKYLVLPLHHKVSETQAKYICNLINNII